METSKSGFNYLCKGLKTQINSNNHFKRVVGLRRYFINQMLQNLPDGKAKKSERKRFPSRRTVPTIPDLHH